MILFMCCVLPAPAGCSAKQVSDRDLVLVDPDDAIRAARGTRTLGVLGDRTPGAWVDARSEHEYREGHIEGAIHMPLERVREDHAQLRGRTPLIVYGNDYNSPRANAVSKILIEKGYKDVQTLRGGLRAWKNAGHTTVSADDS